MSTKLKEYFPILWEKIELLETIRNNPGLSDIFDQWTIQQQQEFINFCTGVRGTKNKKFSYKNIKDVYTIVLYEHSPSEFSAYPDTYLHYFEQQSDSGLKIPLLQKYLFVPLDIFLKIQHNKIIRNKFDAWLLFFASDDPIDIIRLIEEYPEFQAMYEQAYHLCQNMEDIMGLFSEELRILDRNTVQYMIEEMQDTIDAQQASIAEKIS